MLINDWFFWNTLHFSSVTIPGNFCAKCSDKSNSRDFTFPGFISLSNFFLLIHSHGTAAEKQALCNKEQRQAANTLENKKFKIIFWKQWLVLILKFNTHSDCIVLLLCSMPSWKYLESPRIHALILSIWSISTVRWEENMHLSGLYLTLVSSTVTPQTLEVITRELNKNWFGIM